MTKRVVLSFCLLFLFAPILHAQNVLTLPADSLIREGIRRMYNYEQDVAQANFSRVQELHPEHPVGYLLTGVTDWMLGRERLGIEAAQDTLLNRLNNTRSICEKYVSDHPDDPYGWLLYGMTLGLRARADLSESDWMRAAMNGYKGIQQVKKAADLTPDLGDIQLAYGAFHYYVGMSGPFLKVGASLIGLSGTTLEGKEELAYAAENARYGYAEAKSILMYIYGYFEDNIDEALKLARELTAEFPGSPYYWTMRADLEFASAQYVNAKKSMDKLKELLPTLSAFSRDEFEGKYLYLTGLYSHYQGNCQSAVALLTKYLNENADEYDFHDINAELIIGRCHEEMLLVQKASDQYKLVANSELPTRMKMEAERALNNL